MSTLYVPIALAAVGIVLRGAGFAFRKSVQRLEYRRAMGAAFALSSVLTPFFMGAVVGAIAAGNVPPEGNGDAFSSWLAPLPLLTGALFVATGAYLAAVFLVVDSDRAGDKEMEGYFASRALAAGLVAGAFAIAGLIALHGEARYAYERLIVEGLPLVIVSALCGFAVLGLLLSRGRRGLRPLAVGAVVAVIWGWGVAQFPYLLPTSLKISQAAAPAPTLDAVLIVFGAAVLLVLPALGLLYWLSQKELLEE
jgi:cytochrome d ubiquinol oxidase subunit II